MLNRILAWFHSLSPVWLVVMGLVGATVFVGGGVFAYRTYDYIEHDNDFCMSCHLMAEPYELFAESAHRDLGCKACHKPSFAGRSQMALTQIIQNPDSIAVHAEVPNEKCASCHIEGNPEEWLLVANSAGHRVHLESDDPDLQGLQCVQCHSSSLHQFAATDETCAQSGCHTDIEVRLGRMGDLTIHCAACHGFSAVVPEPITVENPEAARQALAPTSDECLSCHVMRTLVEMPPDEPHDAVCSTCHNPHEQTTPEQAGETCANVGCHNDASELTAFHQGLEHAAAQDCMSCHQAHDFGLDGSDCMSCHQDIYDDVGTGAGTGPVAFRGVLGIPGSEVSPHPAGAGPAVALPRFDASHGASGSAALAARAPQEARPRWADTADVRFRHGEHRDVDCASCHDSSEAHGQITVTSLVDCRSCHHTQPAADDCSTCHADAELAPQPLRAEGWAMSFTTGPEAVRDVAFRHGDHADADCATCHADAVDRPAQVSSCNDCHQEHHANPAEVTCMACHAEPSEDAHTVESHTTCGGSGCHTDAPLSRTPRERNACLACHQDLVDHRAPEECVDCHSLPAPRNGSHP